MFTFGTRYPILDYIKMYTQIKVFAGKMWAESTFGLRIWSVFLFGVFCHQLGQVLPNYSLKES